MTHVLVHLEDPGAANLAYPLVEAQNEGRKTSFITSGYATQFLGRLGIRGYEVGPETDLEHMIRQLKPSAVLCGTSGSTHSTAIDLLDSARRNAIPTLGFVDFAANADRRFAGASDDPLAHLPDHVLVADDTIRNTFLKLGCPEDSISVIGHPTLLRVFDHSARLLEVDRARLRQKVFGGHATKPIVLVPAEPMKGTYGQERYAIDDTYTFPIPGGAQWRTEVALNAILVALEPFRNRIAVGLRMHPKCDRADFDRLAPAFDFVDSHGEALESAYASDLVIGQTSMILLESAALGIPTASVIVRPSEQDWLPSIPQLAIPKASDQTQLDRIVKGWAHAHHPRSAPLKKSDLPDTGEIVWRKLEELAATGRDASRA